MTVSRPAGPTPPTTSIVVLLDVDNTLLDAERLRADLATGIERAAGPAEAVRFWRVYQELRASRGHVDLPAVIQRFGQEARPEVLTRVRETVDTLRFCDYLYPEAMAVVRHLATFATPVIFSDGDRRYQQRKVRESGLAAAVGGRVLVYADKARRLAELRRRFPAAHYVLVDDKPRVHAALKRALGPRVTTVLVRQGRYADESAEPGPDIVLEGTAALLTLDAGGLLAAARTPHA